MRYLTLVLLLTACGTDPLPQDAPPTCQVVQTSTGAEIRCAGQSPVVISNGVDGADGASGVVAVIDPCGDHPGHHDEVILRLSQTSLIAYFKSGGNEFLTVLQLGAGYTTTDAQACSFTVELNGTVTDQLGGSY